MKKRKLFQEKIHLFTNFHCAILSLSSCKHSVSYEVWERIGNSVKKAYFNDLSDALHYFNSLTEKED